MHMNLDSELGQQCLMTTAKGLSSPFSFLLTQMKKGEFRKAVREQIPSTTSSLLLLVFYCCVTIA